MQQARTDEELSVPKSIMTNRIALLRLAIGLLQGAALYSLYRSFHAAIGPAINGYVLPSLLLVFLFVPVLVVSGLGHLATRRLWIWGLVASILAAVLGFYDIWRTGYPDGVGHGSSTMPSALVIFFTGAGFYIAHALILAAASDNRRIARYSSYFEAAWKLAIQITFSGLFVGVLWLILWLGAALFMLVKLHFLQELLQQPWFFIPVIAFAFSTALHITDVRPGLVRGIRTLLLVLMSWLLPVTTFIVAGFVVSLPFTGLEPLWATRHATAVLLGSSAVLVLLINAAFQGGELGLQVARVLRGSAKIAAALLLPITAIAIYSLGLRVQQYGWTTDRVIAAACLVVAACYACGYAWATISKGEWLRRIAPTNIATAFVILAALLMLFTPIADPARLSVASQLARLESGNVNVSAFDFDYLKFHGERYGQEALQNLKTQATGPDAAATRAKVEAALRNENRWDADNGRHPVADANDVNANITVWPKKKVLPPSFLTQSWAEVKQRHLLPQCLTFRDKKCEAYLIDMNGDSNSEILLKNANSYSQLIIFSQGLDAKWTIAGTVDNSLLSCKEISQALADGTYRVASPLFNDLDVGGQRLHVAPAPMSGVKCGNPDKQ